MSKIKFTFKTTKPTGRYRSFESSYHEIKIKKVSVGSITDGDGYRIRLQVYKDTDEQKKEEPCPWKWITLKKESISLQEAKDFLKANAEVIYNKYKIYQKG